MMNYNDPLDPYYGRKPTPINPPNPQQPVPPINPDQPNPPIPPAPVGPPTGKAPGQPGGIWGAILNLVPPEYRDMISNLPHSYLGVPGPASALGMLGLGALATTLNQQLYDVASSYFPKTAHGLPAKPPVFTWRPRRGEEPRFEDPWTGREPDRYGIVSPSKANIQSTPYGLPGIYVGYRGSYPGMKTSGFTEGEGVYISMDPHYSGRYAAGGSYGETGQILHEVIVPLVKPLNMGDVTQRNTFYRTLYEFGNTQEREAARFALRAGTGARNIPPKIPQTLSANVIRHLREMGYDGIFSPREHEGDYPAIISFYPDRIQMYEHRPGDEYGRGYGRGDYPVLLHSPYQHGDFPGPRGSYEEEAPPTHWIPQGGITQHPGFEQKGVGKEPPGGAPGAPKPVGGQKFPEIAVPAKNFGPDKGFVSHTMFDAKNNKITVFMKSGEQIEFDKPSGLSYSSIQNTLNGKTDEQAWTKITEWINNPNLGTTKPPSKGFPKTAPAPVMALKGSYAGGLGSNGEYTLWKTPTQIQTFAHEHGVNMPEEGSYNAINGMITVRGTNGDIMQFKKPTGISAYDVFLRISNSPNWDRAVSLAHSWTGDKSDAVTISHSLLGPSKPPF